MWLILQVDGFCRSYNERYLKYIIKQDMMRLNVKMWTDFIFDISLISKLINTDERTFSIQIQGAMYSEKLKGSFTERKYSEICYYFSQTEERRLYCIASIVSVFKWSGLWCKNFICACSEYRGTKQRVFLDKVDLSYDGGFYSFCAIYTLAEHSTREECNI